MPETRSIRSDSEEMEGQPPRPPNCFILYRIAKLEEMRRQAGGKKTLMGDASRIIGKWWRRETPVVRRIYKEEAARKAREHAERYPHYKYQPRTREQKARDRGQKHRGSKRGKGKKNTSTTRAETPRCASRSSSAGTPPSDSEPSTSNGAPLYAGPIHSASWVSPFATHPPYQLSSTTSESAGPSSQNMTLPAPALHVSGFFYPMLPVAASFPPPSQPNHFFPPPSPVPQFDGFNSFDAHAMFPCAAPQPWNAQQYIGQQAPPFPDSTANALLFPPRMGVDGLDATMPSSGYNPEDPLGMPELPADWLLPPQGSLSLDVPDVPQLTIEAPLPRWPTGCHPTYPQVQCPTPGSSAASSLSSPFEEYHMGPQCPISGSSTASALSSPFEEDKVGPFWGVPEKFDISAFGAPEDSQ
ncbi:hypothetical protein BN946_scf184994.g56 [Trametes cinnabarina]|uniref:HMG box domain-containing protein n=1 Tax=Pycnoporus cinnabarinus TaxID=5643 RepID=A0A060SK85_PYCCI|nr:hypothetical protein BN946_scf184994.g56 [Trametes cinnabarina]